jgi:hypothetical protein
MYNPAPELIMRCAVNDHFIGKIPIKKATNVSVSILGLITTRISIRILLLLILIEE